MNWELAWSDGAIRDMERLDRRVRQRVIRAIERLAAMEYGDVARLRGQSHRWRLRAGDWRVLFSYQPEEHTIRILSIRHRREAYR